MTEAAKKRRLQDALAIAGNGVIAFCVWSIAKIGLFLMFADGDALRQLFGISDDSLAIVTYSSSVIIALVDMGLRAYVGMSARAEGRGEKRGPFYLVVAAMVAAGNTASLFAIALGTSYILSPLNIIITIAIEGTALAALVLVIYCSICLRGMEETKG